MKRAMLPVVAGLLGLLGALGVTLYLHGAANSALDRVLEERILGAGDTAAEMVGRSVPSEVTLRAVMTANQLEGVALLGEDLTVLADATGAKGHRADLLRVDRTRVEEALRGRASLAFSYAVGDVKVATGYFPVRGADGGVHSVLTVEGGQALGDILGEVERLRKLTDDFLDLAGNRPMASMPVDVAEVADEAGRALGHAHPEVEVTIAVQGMVVAADPGRLRQVFANLFANAAQAGARRVTVAGRADGDLALVDVRDDGPGIDAALWERLFDPFASGRKDGTGLGLAICRRIVEAHEGHIEAVADAGPGTTFRLQLPLLRG